MAIATSCVFCGRSDRPLTREHVFARWLIQKVHGSRIVASSAASPEPVRPSRIFATVCADCNAGWMSGLEVSFRRLVFARERAGAIAAVDRTALSRWFTKTAVLVAHAQGVVLVDARGRAQLPTGMPDGVEVSLARLRRPRQHIDFAVISADAVRGARVAILVDDLVSHVSAPGALDRRQGTRLWPLRTHALRWDTLPVIASLRDARS
jgi:hypothetical protein